MAQHHLVETVELGHPQVAPPAPAPVEIPIPVPEAPPVKASKPAKEKPDVKSE